MTSSPAPDLDELEKLAEAAGLALPLTTGEPRGCDDWPPNNRVVTERGPITLWLRPELSAYIVALVNAAPTLLQEVRAARAAVAESGRLREALAEALTWGGHDSNCPVRYAQQELDWCQCAWPQVSARLAALLATPPAPSDHGAATFDRDRLVELGNLVLDGMKVAGPGGSLEIDHRAWRERAAKVLGIFPDAAPSVPPEEGT